MPWAPELFSAPALERLEQERRQQLMIVPYFDGLLAGEPDALVESFAVTPELHDPVRGRVRGARAFAAFVSATSSWLREHNVSVEDVEHVVTERGGFEEVVLHLDGRSGPIDLPVAVVADRRSDGRIEELRICFSNWPLAGRHANRPPLLQSDPDLRESDVVGDYQRALAAGDVDAIVAAFEPAGGAHVHRGRDAPRSFYELLFSNGGGIPLEHCAAIDDGRACLLEYNVVRWAGRPSRPRPGSPSTCGAPEAGSPRPASTTTPTLPSAGRSRGSRPSRFTRPCGRPQASARHWRSRSGRLRCRGDLAAEHLQRGDVDLGERRERLDRVDQDVELDMGADRERGLLQPLPCLRAERVGARESLAVAEERQKAVLLGVPARVRGGLRHLGQRHHRADPAGRGTHRRGLRIRVDDARDGLVVGPARITEDVRGDHLALVLADVGQRPQAVDVPDRP